MEQNKFLAKAISIGVISLIVVVYTYKSLFITIESGEAGVLYQKFSGGTNLETTYGEGFHVIAPWNTMITYEVRQQEVKEKMAVLSSNGLEINVELSAWYQPEYDKLPSLHQEKGSSYVQRVVLPSIRSATRSVVGRYTPEEIYSTKRDAIQTEINDETRKILATQYIQLNETLVRDITLPSTIKQAIENKLKQEQLSKEYEFKLKKEKQEAERIRIAAEGKAEANRVLSASLTDKILKDKGIEATLELSKSENTKVIVVGGGKDGLPLILGNN